MTNAAEEEDLLDSLFHGCAFLAFVEQAMVAGTWPQAEATRVRAYRLYEEALAARERTTTTQLKEEAP